jgi:hypothetical protein
MFELLGGVAWADGRLVPAELAAARGAASALGFDDPFGKAYGEFFDGPVELTRYAAERIDPRDRQVVLAGGVWLALADDELTATEVTLLRSLAGRMGMSEDEVHFAFDMARWVRTVCAEPSSWRREFERLLLATRLVLDAAPVGAQS